MTVNMFSGSGNSTINVLDIANCIHLNAVLIKTKK